ncbi:MAG: metallophosphoesterase [Clostridia bacterium]|nr:metallophosphoesterase [Clostridia bacterium]
MKKALRITLVLILLLLLTVGAFSCKNPWKKDKYVSYTMDVRSDGTFKILQITDMHLINATYTNDDVELDVSLRDEWAMECVSTVINEAKPDMIMVTGDSVYCLDQVSKVRHFSSDNEACFRKFADFIDSFKIPWAFCFGNHDEEGDVKRKATIKYDKTLAKKELSAYLTSGDLKYCMYVDGPDEINGVGNYIINVLNKNGSVNNAIVIMDSGSYLGADDWKYEYVHDDQLDWYERAIKHIALKNQTLNVSSIIFQHIPFNEYRYALERYIGALTVLGEDWKATIKPDGTGTERSIESEGETITYHGGVYNEGEICASYIGDYKGNYYDGGHEFERILKLGSTQAVFCGHDHRNTFSFTYKGVRLTYGMSVDYSANGLTPLKENQRIFEETVQRGGTLITLHADSSVGIEQIHFDRNLYQEELVKRGQAS